MYGFFIAHGYCYFMGKKIIDFAKRRNASWGWKPKAAVGKNYSTYQLHAVRCRMTGADYQKLAAYVFANSVLTRLS